MEKSMDMKKEQKSKKQNTSNDEELEKMSKAMTTLEEDNTDLPAEELEEVPNIFESLKMYSAKPKKKKKIKNILDLGSKDVFDYFMKSEQYHGMELPEYFTFDKVLAFVRKTIGNKSYKDCLSDNLPDNMENVNMDILINKDGHYGIRPLVIANPYLYYFLVREICSPKGWKSVRKCFKNYAVKNIQACAIPIVPPKGNEVFYKASTILNWWNKIEQQSLELSLEYRYMFVTDITNCYGSINPQSIEWALNCRGTKHENDENTELAGNIQTYLRALQHGHNIGIPQGSALFDIISEMVLGYSDLLLHEALEKADIEGYEILRYRDDYRVFCNDKGTLEKISYTLQKVLDRLNFRMNSQKTKISDSIVTDSIKPDKLAYIYNTPIMTKEKCDFDGLQKHLTYILLFSREHHNCGQIKTMLSDLYKRIDKKLNPDKHTKGKNEKQRKGFICENVTAMCAIALQIALENVTACHYALRIISQLLDARSYLTENEKVGILDRIYKKLRTLPNSEYNQLWLQNITYNRDKEKKRTPYTMRLCKLVMGEYDETLWNNEWLKQNLTESLPYDTIVDAETLKKVTPVITFRETRAYEEILGFIMEQETCGGF